ncbi:DinB family protein [Wenjunlia tyrosinilytica]|uniref:Methyltransferase type 12 n=1 Tax=Wenjunlia tyrosinilytica TaxID=1544741 RepID=A0A917ZWK4_9ACTN|nr:DinB family protein [Wenjunlia tyrosinilytica]GGO97615.1 methyltransferase type 12 [Wenjunlia tyrosinilytica]
MITPDTKDWTWVVQRQCPECGFDASAFPREEVADRLRRNAEVWTALLAEDPEGLRLRPDPQTWSALEYACHVRDVCRTYDRRLGLMTTLDNPLYPDWDQDTTAVEERYNEQDPATVANDLRTAAGSLASGFDRVEGGAWARPGRRSDGARFTVDSFARYFLHDVVHHLYDVTGVKAD